MKNERIHIRSGGAKMLVAGSPGGVLHYVTLTGTCGPIGYGFQGVLS